MISGAIESKVNDRETRIYRAGESWSEPLFLGHVLGGIEWAAGSSRVAGSKLKFAWIALSLAVALVMRKARRRADGGITPAAGAARH